MQPAVQQSNLPYYNDYMRNRMEQQQQYNYPANQQRNSLNQSYDYPNNNNYSMIQQRPPSNEFIQRQANNLNRSFDVNPYMRIDDPGYRAPQTAQQQFLPQPQLNNQNAQELKQMIDAQNSMIVSMISKIQEDKEKKMRDKNNELLQRIKRLERKKRRLAGEDVGSDDDEIMTQYQDQAAYQQQQQQFLLPPQQMMELNQQRESQDDKESVFKLADSLVPGTYVPIIPYEGDAEYFMDNPFSDAEDKIRSLKERLRDKVGDYGANDGLSLQERVKQKLQNYHNNVPAEVPASRGSRKTQTSLFLGQNENENAPEESLHSRQSIKFQEVVEDGNPQDNSFMGKFLKKIERDKQIVGQVYQTVKKDIPKRDFADLIRDFRIDEEDGMKPDPRLEPKDANKDKLSLLDKISQFQKNKIQQFIQNDKFNQNQNGADQINLIQEILDYEKNEDTLLKLIDRQYPCQDEALRWLLGLIKPFLLTIFNEPRYDYQQLIIEKTKARYGQFDPIGDVNHDGEGEIVRISKENLKKKFEIRLKQLVNCFSKIDLMTVPSGVLDYLKTLIRNPVKDDLTFMELNRINYNPLTQVIEDIQTPEEIMLIGMYLIGKILSVKIFLQPQASGMGVQPSKLVKRNLKLFGTVLYQSFSGFVVRSIKVKRTDFRNDSDMISQALYDKYIIDKYLIDLQKEHEVEQSLLEFIGKIQFLIKDTEKQK